jgi:hypothetical protein
MPSASVSTHRARDLTGTFSQQPHPASEIVARGEWAKTVDPAAQRLRDRI